MGQGCFVSYCQKQCDLFLDWPIGKNYIGITCGVDNNMCGNGKS